MHSGRSAVSSNKVWNNVTNEHCRKLTKQTLYTCWAAVRGENDWILAAIGMQRAQTEMWNLTGSLHS